MEAIVEDRIRRELETRRERLNRAVERDSAERHLVELLDRVDGALAELAPSQCVRCVVCDDPVADDELAMNPLLEYCLCALSPAQQRELEEDLALARRLQVGLLPDPELHTSGWNVSYLYEPAGVVSGDTCDLVVNADDGSIFFAVADVAGKGVAASLLMTHIQAAFRSMLEPRIPLGELVARVNRQLLAATLPAHYATLACGRAHASGHVEIVNAGHASPLVLRGGGSAGVERLAPNGFPVGLVEDRPYDVTDLHLRPGDALLLYTDGLSEATDRVGRLYSERLESSVREASWRGSGPSCDAGALVRALREDLSGFLRGSSAADDLTIMALVRD